MIASEDEKLKKEKLYQHEEEAKCEKIAEQILEAEKEIRLAQHELERREKLAESLQQKQEEQQKLQEMLSKLLSN